jgi:hypothetical protein
MLIERQSAVKMSFIAKRGLSTLIPPKVRPYAHTSYMALADNFLQIASPSVRASVVLSDCPPPHPHARCPTILEHLRIRNVFHNNFRWTSISRNIR